MHCPFKPGLETNVITDEAKKERGRCCEIDSMTTTSMADQCLLLLHTILISDLAFFSHLHEHDVSDNVYTSMTSCGI